MDLFEIKKYGINLPVLDGDTTIAEVREFVSNAALYASDPADPAYAPYQDNYNALMNTRKDVLARVMDAFIYTLYYDQSDTLEMFTSLNSYYDVILGINEATLYQNIRSGLGLKSSNGSNSGWGNYRAIYGHMRNHLIGFAPKTKLSQMEAFFLNAGYGTANDLFATQQAHDEFMQIFK